VGDLFDNKSHGIFFQKHCYTSFTFNRVCVYVFKKKTSAQPYQKPRPNLFLLEPVPVTIDTFRNHSFVGESIWSKCWSCRILLLAYFTLNSSEAWNQHFMVTGARHKLH
jgi:hypothetical protein